METNRLFEKSRRGYPDEVSSLTPCSHLAALGTVLGSSEGLPRSYILIGDEKDHNSLASKV